jgi:hypothetical protein
MRQNTARIENLNSPGAIALAGAWKGLHDRRFVLRGFDFSPGCVTFDGVRESKFLYVKSVKRRRNVTRFGKNITFGTKMLGTAILFCMLSPLSHAEQATPENLLKEWNGRKTGPSEEINVKDSVSQTVVLNQSQASPIYFSAESKAEDATGKPSVYYSIYINITYMDGTKKGGVNCKFKEGTHDWEKSSGSFTPPKPIKLLQYHLLFRKRPGKAWFRNVSLTLEPLEK